MRNYIGGEQRKQGVRPAICVVCLKPLIYKGLHGSSVNREMHGDLPFYTNEEKEKRAVVYHCGNRCHKPYAGWEYLLVDGSDWYNYFGGRWNRI